MEEQDFEVVDDDDVGPGIDFKCASATLAKIGLSCHGNPAATELAFEYIMQERELISDRISPKDILWLKLRPTPKYSSVITPYQRCLDVDLTPLEDTYTRGLKSVINIGTVVELRKFFDLNGATPVKVLIVGAGDGIDLRRMKMQAPPNFRPICVDIIEPDPSRFLSIEEYRQSTGYLVGRTIAANFEDDSDFDDHYDLIIANQCLHYLCNTKVKIRRTMEKFALYLRPGGRVLGTYPQAEQAPVYASAKGVHFIGAAPEAGDWGGYNVSIVGKTFQDPIVPIDLLASTALNFGLIFKRANAREAMVVHKNLVPRRMTAATLDPAAGYFAYFTLTKLEYPTVDGLVPSCAATPSVSWVPTSNSFFDPLMLECNTGVPASLNDVHWLITSPVVFKEKSDGVRGIIAIQDKYAYLIMAGGSRWRYTLPKRDAAELAAVMTGSPKGMYFQVEVVGDPSQPNVQVCLADPLNVAADSISMPFATRLVIFRALSDRITFLRYFHANMWMPFSEFEREEKRMRGLVEGWVFQYSTALPVVYRGFNQSTGTREVRSSMRYFRYSWGVDLAPGQVVPPILFRGAGGLSTTFVAKHAAGIAEYTFEGPTKQFVFRRARPDKLLPSNGPYFHRLNNALSMVDFREIIIKRSHMTPIGRAPAYLVEDDVKAITSGEMVHLVLSYYGNLRHVDESQQGSLEVAAEMTMRVLTSSDAALRAALTNPLDRTTLLFLMPEPYDPDAYDIDNEAVVAPDGELEDIDG